MLNIASDVENKFKRENEIFYLKPKHIFDITPDIDKVKEISDQLF